MNLDPKKIKNGRVRPVLICGKSRTKQSFKDQTDINKIVARFERTGLIDHVNKNAGIYADVSNLRDYPSALRLINKGKALMEALPASLRQRFENNPANLISFLDDPKNNDEAVKLGLRPKPPKDAVPKEPAPSPVPSVAPKTLETPPATP